MKITTALIQEISKLPGSRFWALYLLLFIYSICKLIETIRLW